MGAAGWVPEEAQIEAATLELFGAIVSHNVDSLKFTTDLIIEGLEKERDRFAKALLDIVSALEDIPAMTRTVYVDQLISHHAYLADKALALLTSSEEKS